MLDVFSALWTPPSVVLGCPPNRGNISNRTSCCGIGIVAPAQDRGGVWGDAAFAMPKVLGMTLLYVAKKSGSTASWDAPETGAVLTSADRRPHENPSHHGARESSISNGTSIASVTAASMHRAVTMPRPACCPRVMRQACRSESYSPRARLALPATAVVALGGQRPLQAQGAKRLGYGEQLIDSWPRRSAPQTGPPRRASLPGRVQSHVS